MSLPESEWSMLIESIQSGRCLLVLGPAIAKDQGDPNAQPVAEILAKELQEELSGAPVPPDFQGALPLVGQLWLSYGKYLTDLQIRTRNAYTTRTAGWESAIHAELACMPFRLCLTTTPDHFMLDAFEGSGLQKRPHWAYYDYDEYPDQMENPEAPKTTKEVPAGQRNRPLVFGLMGDMEKSSSLIVAEGALLDALFQFQRGSGVLPASVASDLADRRNSFLFLGFDFERCYARLLVHALKRNRAQGSTPSLGVAEPRDFVVREEPVAADDYFKIVHSIEIRHTDWYTFAKELHQRYSELAPSKPESAGPLPGSPKVFLCHDTRDRDVVERLEGELHSRGVDTWRDVDQLRGGIDWDRHIRYVLSKKVDYVLVCESPNMLEPGEKYFRAEIQVAIQRQAKWGSSIFLIPGTIVSIPGCDRCGLDELDHLNRLDLTTPNGIEKLCDDILADWKERRGSTTS